MTNDLTRDDLVKQMLARGDDDGVLGAFEALRATSEGWRLQAEEAQAEVERMTLSASDTTRERDHLREKVGVSFTARAQRDNAADSRWFAGDGTMAYWLRSLIDGSPMMRLKFGIVADAIERMEADADRSVEEEREQCALVAEHFTGNFWSADENAIAERIATAIRARSNDAQLDDSSTARSTAPSPIGCADEVEALAKVIWAAENNPAAWGDFSESAHDGCRAIARAVLTHLRAQRKASDEAPVQTGAAVSVPEGWRVVPIEPTPRMLECAGTVDGFEIEAFPEADAAHVRWWKDMLSASPSPPVQEVRGRENPWVSELSDATNMELAALLALRKHSVPSDVLEMLTRGDGRGTVAPGALRKAIKWATEIHQPPVQERQEVGGEDGLAPDGTSIEAEAMFGLTRAISHARDRMAELHREPQPVGGGLFSDERALLHLTDARMMLDRLAHRLREGGPETTREKIRDDVLWAAEKVNGVVPRSPLRASSVSSPPELQSEPVGGSSE